MTTAKTTIMMPAYNVGPYIGDAIESVIAQTRGDWRLHIVNDGSTDNTSAVVRQFAHDKRIRLIEQENAGAPVARNRAAKEADTEYLSMLDSDDAWAPDYLEKMLAPLEADTGLAFTCCDAYTFVDEKKPGNRCSENTMMTPPVTLERVAKREFQVYTAVTMRRSWFDRVGGFDEELRNAQDFDLWIRILAAGGKAHFAGEPLAWYRDTPDSLSSNVIRLSTFTIKVYEKLQAARPDMADNCGQMIEKHRYFIALTKAKLALKEGRFAEFQEQSRLARNIRRNFKLSAAAAFAKVAPALARRFFNSLA